MVNRLSSAIRQINLTGRVGILSGSDAAAAQYFRKASEASLGKGI